MNKAINSRIQLKFIIYVKARTESWKRFLIELVVS